MSAHLETLARRFRAFSERECRGVSPLYEALAAAIADDEEILTLAGQARPGQPPANMLLAAVHDLLLSGREDIPLARFYASLDSTPTPAAEAYPAFRDFCRAHAEEIGAILARRVVSTNEPARAACLLPALVRAAERLGEPLQLIEIGASAGLLLLWDRYGYDYGPAGQVGASDNGLTLSCALRGTALAGFPPARLPELAARIGLDRFPLDPRNDDDRAWLRALIWPEQQARRSRLEHALSIAAQAPPEVIAGDGIAQLESVAQRLPSDGTLCVLHAFALVQANDAEKQRFEASLESLSHRRPIARIGFEWQPDVEAPLVSLRLYREGTAEDDLALHADAHGAWLAWP